jgi:histidinol-phosphate aminotransferase
LSIRPKPEIYRVDDCVHGGPDFQELKSRGLRPEDVIDFSVSTNPFSYPPEVKEALSSVVIDRYPDSESTELREYLSVAKGIPVSSILVGNGSTEIIRLTTLAYFGRGDPVLILKPTFGEYQIAAQIAGARILEHWAKEEDGYAFKVAEIVAFIRKHRPKGIFICNPNNPTGQYLSQQEITKILMAAPQSLVILDEAYCAFTEESWSSRELIDHGNIISVFSMTKDYSLSGLRLGYAVASGEIIRNLRRVCPPWNVNAVAQAAGLIALKNSAYPAQCEVKVREAKQFLMQELAAAGFTVLPSKTNFFLVKTGNGGEFRSILLGHGMMVRDCSSFGLPEYVRIAARTMPECRKLIKTVRELIQRGELPTGTGKK